jgi:hypothetical protein
MLEGHEAFLVIVELGHGPGGQVGVHEVGVHLTVSVHRGDRLVVGDQSGVALLEEEAEVGILEAHAVSAMGAEVVSEFGESAPEAGEQGVMLG